MDLTKSVEAFDIILCKSDGIIGQCINILQLLSRDSSDYTHVGIAINLNIFPPLSEYTSRHDEIYVWESNITEDKFGVQIRSLKSLISSYDHGCVAKLSIIDSKHPMKTHDINTIRKKMSYLYTRHGDKSLEYDPIENMDTVFKCSSLLSSCIPPRDDDKILCSELVSHILIEFNVIDTDPHYIVPADFTLEKYTNIFLPPETLYLI